MKIKTTATTTKKQTTQRKWVLLGSIQVIQFSNENQGKNQKTYDLD